MINIRLAVSLAALLAAGWLGYRWGSSGLEKARDELAAIAQTGSAGLRSSSFSLHLSPPPLDYQCPVQFCRSRQRKKR